jgi:hypothetical protein
VTAQRRIEGGHRLMRAGLAVRSFSAPLAAAVGAALLAVQVAGAAGPGLWQSVAVALGVFLGGRLCAASLGGLGWLCLPRSHRSLLVRVALGELPPQVVGLDRAAKLDLL